MVVALKFLHFLTVLSLNSNVFASVIVMFSKCLRGIAHKGLGGIGEKGWSQYFRVGLMPWRTLCYSIIRSHRNRNGGCFACYIRNNLCFNIKNIFSNSIEHVFFEILIPKVKPIAIRIFYRPPNGNDFLIIFSNDFQQIDSKTNEIIFSETLISTYFKMENLSSKKISHINLKVPVLP